MKHSFTIPRFRPTTINRLLAVHPMARGKMKRGDYELIATYGKDLPKATGTRRVSLKVTLGPSQRGADRDAYWKVILDGLVKCGLLIDDNRQNADLGEVSFARGAEPAVEIILEDLESKRALEPQ